CLSGRFLRLFNGLIFVVIRSDCVMPHDTPLLLSFLRCRREPGKKLCWQKTLANRCDRENLLAINFR
ncbi:hypothetical protein, partial [Enterobacter hormaechei]|uniref:hypothetical protein n=2 Tax=Enterobacteriaceae TaxID=543 RepID=UPI001A9C3554